MSRYTKAVESHLKGITAVSTGVCPGCFTCAREHGFEDEEYGVVKEEEFEEAYRSGKLVDEPHFSWTSCGICGSTLGGNRSVWHGIFETDMKTHRSIQHFDDACADCVVFLANGDEPDRDGEEE